ncbi:MULTISPECIES: hypothetical protein [unclassified Bradyrhizobium]|uniref:hypothetical protein n=1 Tax=unclassified Bradyrhizobium TaxID=2631580 RepID=UPI002478A95B|nr:MULTISPECIES: hypothetical protein [unclassified Bradyrhizobium]WGS19193.1 hypothetical protein MTX22_32900 [Bradyrhizobium sp. ISRA463]WGS26029.1 hypothetical protein MTX19_30430 [Bradyrhizobium sp. ISRA464]
MDFMVSPRVEDFRARIVRFVKDRLLPLKANPANYDAHDNIRLDLANELSA